MGDTYLWTASGGAGLGILDRTTGSPYATPVPAPTSVWVSVDYTYQSGMSGTTSGDTTTFKLFPFAFTIWGTGSPNWPGFEAISPYTLSVTVPTTGRGLDEIAFFGAGPFATSGSMGSLTIWAPLGTLSKSTELPANLDGFEQYGQTNLGGEWSFGGADGYYYGTARGWLGPPLLAPEPGSVLLLAIGIAGLCAARRFVRPAAGTHSHCPRTSSPLA
jgi:hypothetical protein